MYTWKLIFEQLFRDGVPNIGYIFLFADKLFPINYVLQFLFEQTQKLGGISDKANNNTYNKHISHL